ncbi:galactonate dehydratase [Rhizobiales bacterium GAS188]|nr:galactonate dehydratase [Rhizobiales bacterium GAS188]
MSRPDITVSDVIAHPLTCALVTPQRTGHADYPVVSIVLAEIRTDAGITGFGECLGRFGPTAYAEAMERLLKPLLIGTDALAIQRHWRRMQRVLSGRSGGMLVEAMAGIDIALWDIAGQVAGLPVHRLLGGMGRARVGCYGSSINWLDDGVVRADTEAFLKRGLASIKVKLASPPERAIARARLVREIVGPTITLSADANWAFSVDEAVTVGRALSELSFIWFEEPIVPEDIEGYRHLRRHLAIRLAAGESDFTAQHAAALLKDRLVGLIQPDVARAGGISETRRIYDFADVCHIDYAPHVGWSGAICLAASLQLAAAAPNFLMLEYMTYPNPLRDELTVEPVVPHGPLAGGEALVPQRSGLGVAINWDTVERYRTR